MNIEWININNELPSNEKYRMVMCTDGISICKYNEEDNTWSDRERWHNVVTHWSPLPDEINKQYDYWKPMEE